MSDTPNRPTGEIGEIEMSNSINSLSNMEGKKAKLIYYGRDGENVHEAKESEGYKKEIILTSSYHGEYDMVWFVIYENGKETNRVNAKYVESIIWDTTP